MVDRCPIRITVFTLYTQYHMYMTQNIYFPTDHCDVHFYADDTVLYIVYCKSGLFQISVAFDDLHSFKA